MAFLLFPFKCSCKTPCRCVGFRESAIISLNTKLFNKAEKENKDADFLRDIRFLLRIPEDHFYITLCVEGYPLWMIKKDFKKIDEENYFRNIERFVWTLLRFDKTHEALPFRESDTIMKEEPRDVNFEKKTLKTNVIQFQKRGYLTDEKTFLEHFDTYKSVCHFIAAYEFMKRKKQQGWQFSLNKPNQIQRFLNISHWFRKKLLSLNISSNKVNISFSEEDLVSLPSWIQGNEIDIPVEPFDNKIHEMGLSFLSLAQSYQLKT